MKMRTRMGALTDKRRLGRMSGLEMSWKFALMKTFVEKDFKLIVLVLV
jgi:hypothetical protein